MSWGVALEYPGFSILYDPAVSDEYWPDLWNPPGPATKEVDICGPVNLISSGYALWLVLVPAVACVVQLSGSTFLYRRSNFYRFAPEIGLADCIASLALIGRALLKGYRWKESVAAVFIVREGIGKGDLWWRDCSPAENIDPANESGQDGRHNTPQNSGDALQEQGHQIHDVKRLLKPYIKPFSLERVIGDLLFVITLTKAIAAFSADSSNPALRVTFMLALAYTLSFVIFELLVWSLAIITPSYSLDDISDANLLELLRHIDPGDNPFTFPRPSTPNSTPTDATGPISATQTLPTASPPSIQTHRAVSTHKSIPWVKPVAASALTLTLLGPLFWTILLAHIWGPSRLTVALTTAALSVLLLRTTGKLARLPFANQFTHFTGSHRRVRAALPQALRKTVAAWRRSLRKELERRPWVVRWLLDRVTGINMLAAGWVVVECVYFAGVFARHARAENGEMPRMPEWVQWLG